MTRDLRHALRRLAGSPGFTATVALTLALGIGANTAIYTVARHTLLEPPPYAAPDRTVVVASTFEEQGWAYSSVSIPEMADQDERNPLLEDIAVFDWRRSVTLVAAGRASRLQTTWVTSSYFPLLGVSAAHGRTFLPREDEGLDAHPVAVVSDRMWHSRLGSDPDVVGSEIRLTGRVFTVIGVMPPEFRDLTEAYGVTPEIWLPLSMGPTHYGSNMYETRGNRQYRGLARLAEGASIDEARARAEVVALELAAEYPDAHRGRGISLRTLPRVFYEELEGPLLILQSAALLVLLICCVNVATLLLVRARSRRAELAMRAALGAPRLRLTREMLVESLVLAVGGGGLGIVLAVAAVSWMARFGAVHLPDFVVLDVDGQVIGVSLALVLATGFVFGLAPGLQAARTDPATALKAGERGTSTPVRGLFPVVAAEVALAVVLLIAAGLLIRSFQRFANAEMGFSTQDLVTMRLELPRHRLDWGEDMSRFGEGLANEIAGLPGVEAAGLWAPSMLGAASWHMNLTPGEADPTDSLNWRWVQRIIVTPGALDAMEIPIVAGRGFHRGDWGQGEDLDGDGQFQGDERRPSAVIVSQQLAERLWPGREAVGRRVQLWGTNGWPATVVGVAAEAMHRGRRGEHGVEGDIYLSFYEWPSRTVSLLLRSRSGAAGVADSVRRVVEGFDPEMVVFDVATFSERLERENAEPAFTSVLMGFYAATATLLAAMGIFGVLAYSVRQRTAELAIRLAVGARRSDLLKLVLSQGMRPVVVGLAAGMGVAWVLVARIRDLLFAVPETDPLSWMGAAIVLFLVALLAAILPARRASLQDPMTVLRQE